MRLQNKVAVVTGAASGIGQATALMFAKEGAAVAVLDRDTAGAARTVDGVRDLGGVARSFPVDVSNNGEVIASVAAVLGAFGRIDVLFNNAGISCVGALHETTEAEWDRVMAVNLKGVYLVSRAVLPHMRSRRVGVIINMSSSIAEIGVPMRAAYSASKGAVLSLTRAMQADYASDGIRINALLPGTILTPFVQDYLKRSYPDPEAGLSAIRKRQVSGDLGTPEDVAAAALFLASDDARFMFGSGLVIDGGLTGTKV